ncbi:hypothetical protein [Modicisalibacter luteus]|uniref:Type II toxin-antitoxin system RelE/ParE family toxin n=1 Tax=Modicisalibacter luteus TaxID=453962 RepID=A0ABV7M487_9GAMM|nr:hypothetical protein [Halomonas lutea]GHA88916.1 hypothetical protein GCM10007159_08030 [Halomonas lutea]
MKILITEQFNKAVKKLNQEDQKSVFALFARLEATTKEELFSSGKLIKISSPDEKIFVIRSKFIRVFCTFETAKEEEDLILLDVIRKNSSRLKMPFNLTRPGSRTR